MTHAINISLELPATTEHAGRISIEGDVSVQQNQAFSKEFERQVIVHEKAGKVRVSDEHDKNMPSESSKVSEKVLPAKYELPTTENVSTDGETEKLAAEDEIPVSQTDQLLFVNEAVTTLPELDSHESVETIKIESEVVEHAKANEHVPEKLLSLLDSAQRLIVKDEQPNAPSEINKVMSKVQIDGQNDSVSLNIANPKVTVNSFDGSVVQEKIVVSSNQPAEHTKNIGSNPLTTVDIEHLPKDAASNDETIIELDDALGKVNSLTSAIRQSGIKTQPTVVDNEQVVVNRIRQPLASSETVSPQVANQALTDITSEESNEISEQQLSHLKQVISGKKLDKNASTYSEQTAGTEVKIKNTADKSIVIDTKTNNQKVVDEAALKQDIVVSKPINSLSSSMMGKPQDVRQINESTSKVVLTEATATTEHDLNEESLIESATKTEEISLKATKEVVVGSSAVSETLAKAKTDTVSALDTDRTQSNAINRSTLESLETKVLEGQNIAQQQTKHVEKVATEIISLNNKNFVQQMKEKVMIMVSQKLQSVDIQLDPPELGNVHVRVNLQGEQAMVSFMVQQPQAKDALEQHMNKLRDLLDESGIDLGDTDVQQQFSQNDETLEENNEFSDGQASAQNGVEEDNNQVNDKQVVNVQSIGIDYFA